MDIGTLKKVAPAPAKELCAELQLEDEAKAILLEGQDVQAFIKGLIDAGMLEAACKVLARALPRREAVWWACLCARCAMPPDAPDQLAQTLAAAEAWVYKPADDIRRAAYAKAEAIGLLTPPAWAAMAAYWADGSMAPPDAPMVPAPAHLTAIAVGGAMALAAVVDPAPDKIPAAWEGFLTRGLDIAQGGNGRLPDDPPAQSAG